MKLIHTSDWHLGHELFTYDRSEEQLSFLEQLREIVREEQPDALVVSGDIYLHLPTQPCVCLQMDWTKSEWLARRCRLW